MSAEQTATEEQRLIFLKKELAIPWLPGSNSKGRGKTREAPTKASFRNAKLL